MVRKTSCVVEKLKIKFWKAAFHLDASDTIPKQANTDYVAATGSFVGCQKSYITQILSFASVVFITCGIWLIHS